MSDEGLPNPYSRGKPVVPKLPVKSPSPSPPQPAVPKVPYQAPGGQSDWIKALHERCSAARASCPRVEPGRPKTQDAVNEMGRKEAQARTAALGVSSSSASKAGMPPVLLSQAMEVQQVYHREVGATFQSGFEPQRHSTYVLGRPVQVGLMGERSFQPTLDTKAFEGAATILLLLLSGLDLEASCLEVLALTHENATAEERMPYLSWLFDPVPVFNLVGRSANMTPPCKKNVCVWYAWKEWHHCCVGGLWDCHR